MSTLGALLNAYMNLIADWLLNECDPDIDPTKFRMLCHHGHGVPDDVECSPEGLLSAWWTTEVPKERNGCPTFPIASLNAKYATCWKLPKVTPKNITLEDPTWHADALRLADIADCITRRLFQAVCTEANAVNPDDDPYLAAFLLYANAPQFVEASAGGPQGGIAWITWRMTAGVRIVVPEEPVVGESFARTATDTVGTHD